jgi:cytoskeletal protein CcmA (bactofilin family)
MHIQSGNGHDIVLAPQGAGIVQVVSALEVAESLTVGNPPLMTVDPDTNTVAFGSENARADVTVTGDVTFSDTLTIRNGGITVLNGDVRFGNADVQTAGDLTVKGDVMLGDSAADLVTVRGMLKVLNDDGTAVVQIHPGTGDIQMMGSLTVEKDTELRGDVVLGSKPTDTVTINAYATQMNSLIATGFVQLGDDDDDTITIYGSLRVRNDNNDIVFDVDPYTGDTFTEGSLSVSGDTTFLGSLKLGDGSRDVNGELEDLIEINGQTTLNGDVTVKSSLTVLGDTRMQDLYAENVTLVGMLRMRNAADKVTFDVNPETGRIHSTGSLELEGDAHFMQNVVLGDAEDDHIRFNGQVLMRAALTTEKDVTIMGDAKFEADATVLGDVGIGGELRVAGDVYLGDSSSDEIVLRGHLLVKSGARSVFSVNPTNGNMMTEGTLQVAGKANFESAVEIGAPLTVEGATVIRKGLDVGGAVSVGGDLSVAGDTTVGGQLLVKEDLQVDGDVQFGSTDANELTVRGHLLLRNSLGSTQFRVNAATGDTYAAGSLRVDGAAQFKKGAILGSSASDLVTIHGTTILKADVTAEANVDVLGQLNVHGDTTLHSDLIVHGNVQLGDDVSDVVTVVGDFQVVDASGSPQFTIDAKTGDSFARGSMKINGNLDVNGYITTPEFVVEHLMVDRISERTANAGVDIEGVLFRDGGIAWAKAHEIHEMVSGAGVTVEGVNLKDGAAVLSGKRPGSSPQGEIDLLTLVNSGHDRNMTDTMTSIKWRQYYHDSGENHAPVDSASITVGTENDWTELSSSHNA